MGGAATLPEVDVFTLGPAAGGNERSLFPVQPQLLLLSRPAVTEPADSWGRCKRGPLPSDCLLVSMRSKRL